MKNFRLKVRKKDMMNCKINQLTGQITKTLGTFPYFKKQTPSRVVSETDLKPVDLGSCEFDSH